MFVQFISTFCSAEIRLIKGPSKAKYIINMKIGKFIHVRIMSSVKK